MNRVLIGLSCSLYFAAGSAASATTVLPALANAIIEVDESSVTTSPYTTIDGQYASTLGPSGEIYSPSGTTFIVTTHTHGIVTQQNVTTSSAPAAISVGGAGNIAGASVSGTPSPTVSSFASNPANSFGSASQAHLTYYFEVVAPAGYVGPSQANINVNAIGSVSAASSGTDQSSSAVAALVIAGVLNDLASANYFVSNGNPVDRSTVNGAGFISGNTVGINGSLVTGGFDESGSYAINVGQLYQVALLTNISCGGNGGDACSASIDPTITVGSGLLLDFSPGIGNSVGAVPEPSTWAMLILGFAGISFIGYRRSRKEHLSLSCA
jgi:hypothetical protein